MAARHVALMVLLVVVTGCRERGTAPRTGSGGDLAAVPDAATAPHDAGPEPTVVSLRRRLASAPRTDDHEVAEALQTMAELDQRVRSADVDPMLTAEVDRENTRILTELMAKHGWFGRERFGPDAATNAWIVVQHSPELALQRRVLADFERRGETTSAEYGLLLDRVRVRDGEPQRFGTQGLCKPGGVYEILPIEDEGHVDARRARLGLGPHAAYHAGLAAECARASGVSGAPP